MGVTFVQEEEKNLNSQQQDPFTALMFGARRRGETQKDSLPIESTASEDTSNEKYDWIMGKRSMAPNHQNIAEQSNNTLERILQNIDYAEAAKHVGTLMSSANELKPLLSKVKPLIDTFFPKK